MRKPEGFVKIGCNVLMSLKMILMIFFLINKYFKKFHLEVTTDFGVVGKIELFLFE